MHTLVWAGVLYSKIGWLLEFCILVTFKVPTCDRAHSWQLYSAAPLKNQAMTEYPTQSHYPNTEQLTSPNTTAHQARKRQVSIL